MIRWNEIPVKERKKVYLEKSKGKSILVKNIMLKNMYKGLECICVSPGLSAIEFHPDKIKEFAKDKPFFALKTAALKFKDDIDVCITNYYATFNFPKIRNYIVLARQEMPYGYKNWVNPQLIETKTFSEAFVNEPEILWGSDVTARHSNSVVNANRWEENSIDNNAFNRIIGPGIMNDMVVPILVHCGIKKINMLGWDGAKIEEDGSIRHFYDIEKEYTPTLNYVTKKFNLNNLKSDTHECEQQIAKRGEEAILDYLSSKNIEISVMSKNSMITDKIPRNLALYGE
jgi:hypothetical protein